MSSLLEHDYIAQKPSMEISEKSSCLNLNLKETELRLGLPGSQSPEREPTNVISLFGKDLKNNTNSLKKLVAGSKRGFSDDEAFFGFEGKRNNTHKAYQSAEPDQEDKKKPEVSATNEHASPPSAKAQVVGWPPIGSFRRNTMASTGLTKNKDDEEEGKAEASGCLYVKVSMDGAPYLRKVDLRMCTNYLQLSSALEQMFTCFTIGECNSDGFPGKDGMSEGSLGNLLHVCEYVVTYEDKDGDWMLVGDVPWEMFTESCRRLRIMKGSEAIGLAPRAMEKCRSHNNCSRIK